MKGPVSCPTSRGRRSGGWDSRDEGEVDGAWEVCCPSRESRGPLTTVARGGGVGVGGPGRVREEGATSRKDLDDVTTETGVWSGLGSEWARPGL